MERQYLPENWSEAEEPRLTLDTQEALDSVIESEVVRQAAEVTGNSLACLAQESLIFQVGAMDPDQELEEQFRLLHYAVDSDLSTLHL